MNSIYRAYVNVNHSKQENLSKLFKEIVQFDAGKLQGGGGSGFGLYRECNTTANKL